MTDRPLALHPPALLTAAAALLALGAVACGDDTSGSGGGGGAGGGTSSTVSVVATTTTASTGSGGPGGGGDGGEGGAGGAAIEPRFAPLAAAVEAEMAELGAPGAAVAVIEGGQVTFARGFGERSPGSGEPVSPSTLFRIGSVTKTLTATALLTEVEAGRVGLDDRVVDHVTDFELGDGDAASAVLVRHLLTHSAGMSDYLAVDTPPTQQQDDDLSGLVATAHFRDNVHPMSPAGAFFNYSNPSYYVAGITAERTSGALYRELVAERVLAPLGMDRTFFLPAEVLAAGDFASGITSYPGVASPVEPDGYENAWARPAGYAFSTSLDLARLVTFLLDGDDAVLGDALRGEMQSPVLSTREYADVLSYGYGLYVEEGLFTDDGFVPVRIVSHGGDIPGFAADILLAPDLDFGLVTLASGDGAHLRESTLVALQTLTELPAAIEAPDVSITDEDRARFVGTYQDDLNVGPIVVSQVDDHLEIEMPVLDELDIPYLRQLVHLAEETFVLGVQGTYITLSFLPDEEGEIRYARTRAFVGVRPAAEPQALAVPGAPAVERRQRVLAALRAGAMEAPSRVLDAALGR